VLLPHASWGRGQRRTATAAILLVRGEPVLAYALHLETPIRITPSERRDQIQAVLDDAAGFEGPVVIAGDFNSEEIGLYLRGEGYRWVTEGIGPTVSFFSWDHIFTRGMRVDRTGVVRDIHGASDHRPVWAVVTPVPVETQAPPAVTAASSR
jgi:endonuclease/exonuclease/phosphatase (EEP) superfamily protein YafD